MQVQQVEVREGGAPEEQGGAHGRGVEGGREQDAVPRVQAGGSGEQTERTSQELREGNHRQKQPATSHAHCRPTGR